LRVLMRLPDREICIRHFTGGSWPLRFASLPQLSIKILLIHPGTQHAPRLAEELERQGLLHRFWTGWAVSEKNRTKRSVDIPEKKLRTLKWLEALSLMTARLGLDGEGIWFWRNMLFQKLVPTGEIEAANVVIGFDTASHILAKRTKLAGKPFVLEQSILDPEAKEEAIRKMASRYPDWAGEAEPRSARLLRAERKEQRLADRICVPSDYVGSSLVEFGVPHEKIFVNPYGTNSLPEGAGRRQEGGGEGCRFLFAGTVSGRKGVPLLLEAWAKTQPTQGHLTIAGNLDGWPAGVVRPGNVQFPGQLTRPAMAEAFREHDVFVFPSYAEGMPLVVLEAMAHGLPVIATPVAAGVVRDGVNGILVPFDDPEALGKAMRSLSEDRAKRLRMGQAAKEAAAEFSWEAYGKRYAGMLEKLESSGGSLFA